MECESKAKEDMKKQLEDQCGVCSDVIISLVRHISHSSIFKMGFWDARLKLLILGSDVERGKRMEEDDIFFDSCSFTVHEVKDMVMFRKSSVWESEAKLINVNRWAVAPLMPQVQVIGLSSLESMQKGGYILLMEEIRLTSWGWQCTPLFTGFYTSQVVQDFFHQK